MIKPVALFAMLGVLLPLQATSVQSAAAQESCSRTMLQEKADSYVNALQKGDSRLVPLAPDAVYIENRNKMPFDGGIWQEPVTVDFHRSFLDVETCEAFSEIISATGGHPYVIGTRLKVSGGSVSEVEALVTDEDDWLFNADTYLKYSPSENWEELEAAQRSDRATLISAANAYFDVFRNPSAPNSVPWNIPCARLEGGIYTNPDNDPEASCTGGPPLEGSVEITNRRFIVDLNKGVVVGLANFGDENGWPDSHTFRLENGKVRYVHTLTVCPGGCVLPARSE